MNTSQKLIRRSATSALLFIGGEAVAVAVWVSGDHGFAVAVALIYVGLAAIAFLWAGGHGDIAAILRVQGDERQRGLDRDATAISGLTMTVAAIVGAIVQTSRNGDPGAFGLMCVVGGISYATSLVILRRRR